MARPLRIEYPGAFYHITSRGNKRLPIFQNDLDRKHFLNILAETCATYNWLCHAYCLMDNHYHLLIETLEANLATGMRNLNGIYTQDFNYHHKTVGHLLQGRYKAILIEEETYLREVTRYIVLNPVRANLVRKPERWKWSNFAATCGLISAPDFLDTITTLTKFSKTKTKAQQKYHEFVLNGVGEPSPFIEISANSILGSPQFVAAIWEKAKHSDHITEIPVVERLVGRPSLDDLLSDCESKAERNQGIFLARQNCAYSLTEIARHLNLQRSTVSSIFNKLLKPDDRRPDPV
jgi:REP element-mobilizing transposase RayT